jgi:pilus assembly protein Flp/PilA
MLQNVILQIASVIQGRKGVTALEYGILAAVIVVAVAGAATVLGSDISSAFSTLGDKITTAASK